MGTGQTTEEGKARSLALALLSYMPIDQSAEPVLTTSNLGLFEVLELLTPDLRPSTSKIHLAVHNGIEDPLDVYLAGKFDEWQAEQNNQNFQREHVVALIALPERDAWLFVGAYRSQGCRPTQDPPRYVYDLAPLEPVDSLSGRLVVHFRRPGRQSYLVGENWVDAMVVKELRPERIQIDEFPGYSRVTLTKQQLDAVVAIQATSWRSALSSVCGVYVISDTSSGMLYGGSASGTDGIWGRWSQYSATGHGGNVELVRLLKEQGPQHASGFLFGILEICDPAAGREFVLGREEHWKQLLLSRSHGHNGHGILSPNELKLR